MANDTPKAAFRLLQVPAGLADQREALHRLAMYVIGPARHQQTERFGLRSTPGGFGTPPFGDPETVVCVEGLNLIVESGGQKRSTPITSLQAAADFIGSSVDLEIAAEHDSPPPGDLNEDLVLTSETVDFLAQWWAFGSEALEHVRSDQASVEPSIVQLWPGHFDPAIEVGDEDRRASYGASPGEHTFAQPYIYVSVWWPDRLDLGDNQFWNAADEITQAHQQRLETDNSSTEASPETTAGGFTGAIMHYSELAAAEDPLATAVEFYRTGRDLLAKAANRPSEEG